MKMSKDCRNKPEYDRYHAELSIFLGLKTTKSMLTRDCINAIKQMKRELRSRENKLAGYVRHCMKSHMLAMTTSPVEGQNVHLRHGGDQLGERYHTNDAVRRMVTRIQRNFRARRARAFDELSRNCIFSIAWTGTYFIRKGQALVDRFHAKRRWLKSARLSRDTYITWNFDIDEWMELPDKLYVHLPCMLRVEVLKLSPLSDENPFIKCTCGVREGIGVPCACYFRIGDNAGLSFRDIIHPRMLDIRYWKLFHTHYGTNTNLGEWIYRAQEEAFENESRGIPVTPIVMEKLSREHANVNNNIVYPQLGPNTSQSDLQEALFVRNRETTTVRDMERYRELERKEDYQDGPWSRVNGSDDFVTTACMSPTGRKMQDGIEKSVLERKTASRQKKAYVRPTEERKDAFYTNLTHHMKEFLNDSRTSVDLLERVEKSITEQFNEATKEKCDAFPVDVSDTKTASDPRLGMLGNYGDTTPQKKRKRSRY